MGISYLVFLLAGFATGIITGLVGASAIVVFVPIVLLFLNYSLFALIGVSLAVDVFVSFFALIIYRKFHNIDFKTGFSLSILAVVGAVLGSYLSKFLPNTDLLGITSVVTAFTGIMIFRRKVNLNKKKTLKNYSKSKFIIAIILSFFVGLLGGGLGAAGGICIFLLLIFFLNFETHLAIGTSIFVMFFIALFGSIAHIGHVRAMGFHWELLLFAIIGGVLGSFASSEVANLVNEKHLNKIVGSILFILGTLTFINNSFM
jgi:uncharacterized membrane protein YfcA